MNGIIDSNQKIVANGLTVNLDAAQLRSYPTTGTTWTDLSGNANNFTLTNGATFNSGNGGSIFTDGVDDYIISAYSGLASSSYTFSAWFKNDNLSEQKMILIRGRDGFGQGWSLAITITALGNPLAGVVQATPVGITTIATSATTLAINTWYYLTGVYTSGSSLKIYINGVLDATQSTAITNIRSSTNGWVMGSIAGTNFTSGYTAITHIYERALSDTEILQNFNAQKSRFGL